MEIKFESLGKERSISWDNDNYTIIVADKTDSKRNVLMRMIEWCNSQSFEYITYNVDEILDLEYWLENSTPFEIVSVTFMMKKIFFDFDDFEKFEKARNITLKNPDDYIENIDFVKDILRICGSGHSKIFIMFMKAIKNPTAGYYFLYLPETSLHYMVFEKLMSILLGYFVNMKIIFASNSDRLEDSRVFNSDDKKNFIYV